MGSKIKRFLALLLAVLMLVSTVPVSALATEAEHDHVHETAASTKSVSPASDPDAGDPEDPEDPSEPNPENPEDPSEPNPEDTDPPATEPGTNADQVCYLPGDANSDGEVHVNDAFYVLYSSLMPENYPMNHNGDYDGDGDVDADDALLVLKYVHGMAQKPEYTHVYQAPVWNWYFDEDGNLRASAIFSCACGSNCTVEGSWELAETQSATCTTDGFERYIASVEFEGVTYTNEYIYVTEIKYGHTIDENSVSCEEGAACDRCDYTLEAKGHSWGESVLEEGDCQTPATLTRTCTACDATESEVQAEITYAHAWVYTGDVAVEGIACGYVKAYECSVCGATKDVEYDENGEPTNVFYKHTYTAALTTEATCQQDGVKTLTCTCGDTKTETVEVNPDAHTWVLNNTETAENGVVTLTYTCGCGATKTAVDASNAAVPQEVLAENSGELTVGNVSISMDTDTVSALSGDISVNVSTADKESIALTEDQKAQIGNNPIYDFSMTSGEEAVTEFGGVVTISLPYTLQPGDDVDCIDVWFIEDDGNVTLQHGIYSNGYVTFTTTHFSYYTVTQLTAEERCTYYDHNWKTFTKDATCTTTGYSVKVCERCNAEENFVTYDMLEHEYAVETTAPTCTANGMEVKTCSHCGATSRTTLFALGHNMVVTESVAATCTEAGHETKECSNGECTYTQTTQFDALGHDYQLSETVAPTCTDKGYDIFVCSHCNDTQRRNEQPAIGHDYHEAENGWSWNEDHTVAWLTLVCSHDESHTTTQKAVVSEVIKAASCTAGGTATYTAKLTYNNVSYENVQYSQQTATGHATASEEWQTTSGKHYHTCDTCGVRIDQADHNWGGAEIPVAPSCVSAGKATYACTICGYTRQETVPATGIHTDTDADGTCDICGFREETCTHALTVEKLMDLTGYNVCEGTRIIECSCECGKEKEYRGENFTCQWGESYTYEKELDNGRKMEVTVTSCQNCGIVVESGILWTVIEETCEYDNLFYEKVSIDGEVLYERESHDILFMGHNLEKTTELGSIQAEGFCGAEASIVECYCGGWRVDLTEYNCQWVDIESDDPDTTIQLCTVCGATLTKVCTAKHENCMDKQDWVHTLEYNGEVLSTIDAHVYYESHDNVITYEMHGDTCEDGLTVRYTCSDCGYCNEYYTTDHESIVKTETDLHDWNNPCMVGVIQYTCPCNTAYRYDTVYDVNSDFYAHSWDIIREEDNTIVYACQNCGYTKTYVRIASAKSTDCEVRIKHAETISDGGERSVTVYWTGTAYDHNVVTSYTLLGETCEDGVRAEEICQDCGHINYTSIYNEHIGVPVESFNLSEFGGCDAEITVYQCPCGQDAWWGTMGESCAWEYMGWENGTSTYTCTNCGIVRKDTSKYLGTDGCVDSYLNTISFIKNGRTVKTLSYTNHPNSHDYIYELTLHDGETGTCEDGYDIKATCQKCGHTYEDTNFYGCSIWLVERTVSPDGMFCGNLVADHLSCACGKYMDTATCWENGECSFQTYYDEEKGQWVTNCMTCGIENGETLVEQAPVPNLAECFYQETRTETYYRDGELVYSVDFRNVFAEHDWIATYRLNEGAESCADGYTVHEACTVCGLVLEDFGDSFYNDCGARTVAKTLVASRDDICGDIYRWDNSCACGANSFSTYVMPCPFEFDGIDEETGAERYRCPDCAMRYDILITAETVPGTTCQVSTHRMANYYVGDELLFSEDSIAVNDDHTIVTGFRLLGETCSEGYYVNNKCIKCGTIFWENESVCYDDCYESTYCVDQENICNTECGTIFKETYSCACGKNSRVELWSSCEFWLESSDGNGNDVYRCADCGVERRITRSMELVEGTTCDYLVIWTSQFFDGDVLLGTYVSTDKENRHTEEYYFELLGKDCDDGYRVGSRCSKCGESLWYDEEVYYGCTTYYFPNYDTLYFEDADVCAPFFEVTHTCACGKNSYDRVENHDECQMEWVEWISETDTTVYQCVNCGLIREERRISEKVDTPNCMTCVESVYTFRMGDEVLGQFQLHEQWVSHTYLYTYELLGNTCDDGYNRTGTCYYCGKQKFWETEYGCWAQAVSMEPVLEMDGICGTVYFETNCCACGNEQYTHYNDSCNFDNTYWDEETGGEYAQCPDCGLIRKHYSETVYDTENCTATDVTYYKFYMDGTERASYTVSNDPREYHFTTATFDLLKDSCEDGYRVVHTCRYCDYSRTEEDIWYGHDTYETAVYDLSGLDCCGISLSAHTCPCGQRSSYGFNSDCSFSWTEETDPNGRYLYNCDTCGLQYSQYSTDHVEDVANCTVTYNENFCFYRNGEHLQTVVIPYRGSTHTYVMTGAELNDAELGCEGGYTVTQQCIYCMDAYTSTYEAGCGHNYHTTDVFDVELEGGCHTRYAIEACACGAHDYAGYQFDSCNYEYSSETVEIDGISHDIYTKVCSDCGFTIVEDSYDEPTEDPCKVITHKEITCRLGDKVMTYVGSGENANHDLYPINAELLEGSADCDDGVMVTYACTKCDHVESSEQWGHFTYTDEIHSLADYGSVHGGELAHFLCACGYVSRYDFRNMTCDLDRREIDNFVEGAIENNEWHYTADGSIWIDSEAYLIKCAVTDPQCGLTIRMSEYWLADAEACTVTEYQIWQLGYDEFTGAYEKEIVIPTGVTHTYHSYVHTETSETDDTGMDTDIRQDVCSVCGSSYIERYEYYPNGAYRYYVDAVNTLNDGDMRDNHQYTYYDRVINGRTYETETRSEYTRANGETIWYQDVYLYESDEDPCYYTCIGTNYLGENNVSNGWNHPYNHIDISYPTCTQFGQYRYECVACGAEEGPYDHEPYGHSWYYDESLGCYRCSNCGLENSNGADGSIVMEDMSDEERYMVGYWNKESISFEPRAAVVKYNTESGEEDVVFLEGIDYIHDDISVSVSMDKAQVDALVAERIAGYEGSYAVRLIFVPVNDQSILDYAITFDTCYTEGWVDPDATEPTYSDATEAPEIPEYPEEPTETTEPAA